MGGERKERVLHTRVPASLERHLKRRAWRLGLSVSTVVRNVLLNTFGLVEDIVTDGTNVALALAGEEAVPRERARRDDAPAAEPDVVGWQEAVLNVAAACGRCGVTIRRGARAALGVRRQPGPPVVLCRRCLGGLDGRRPARQARPRRPVKAGR